MSELLKQAFTQYGVKEVSGPQHNKTIVGYAKAIGLDWVNDDETPWCSIFVSWVAKKCKLKYSKLANARSWMNIGLPTQKPEPGDVVVFWRESPESWKGHVGFFTGFSQDGTRVYCLGGNQGNQVSISAYPTDTVLGFRKLQSSSKIINLPDGILKRGDTGERVKQLQMALNMANYNVGTADGIFGGMTETALKKFQTNAGLSAVGQYGPKTRDILSSILSQ